MKRPLFKRSRKAGFTLAEIVMAIAIIAVGLSVFAVSLGMAARATNSARRQMTAMNFARQQIESLRRLSYNDPQLALGTYPISNSLFTGEYVVSDLGTNTRKQLSVRITWVNAAAGNTTNVTYTTQMCNAYH